jgi:serine/threonine protein kinase/tetratricopeptide (TPR) repeat protein
MNPARYARLKEIVLTAAALAGAERTAYLDEACGDDAALRTEADGLLARRGRTADAIRTGALDDALSRAVGAARPGPDNGAAGDTDAPLRASRLPDRVGPYRVVGLLGEGGMGSVYRARQEEPVRRDVAVKLIRGAESGPVLARFESERQTLAQMDHPGIARLLDAGSTTDGRPWFAMQLVEGAPITTFARTAGLAPTARLRLFLDVCRAVRHAHQKGIIHRDLKPSNILVTLVQDQPLPKVIDFSIARALDASLVGETYRTRTGQIVGTVEYMSPEQARGDTARLDTRSDVYSLGVLLYELLADRLPYDVAGRPLHEAVREINDAPPRPLRATRSTGRSTRRLDPDVETIVRKCLEKDPDHRYGSAAELTDDLERLLSARPILARPPSTLYQLRKSIARHRTLSAVVGLAFGFLVIFSITVSYQLGVQRRERQRAEEAARRAAAETRRAEAEARKESSVRGFLVDLLNSSDVDQLGPAVTVRQALDAAAQSVDEQFADDPDLADAVRAAIADAYQRSKVFDRAETLQRAIVASIENRLGPDHQDLGVALDSLAGTLFYEERYAEAKDLAQRGLAILERQAVPDSNAIANCANTLGLVLIDTGDFAGAEVALRRAVTALEVIPRRTPGQDKDLATCRESLANVLFKRGRYAESETLMRGTLESVKARAARKGVAGTDVSTAMFNLATILTTEGKHSDAEPLYRAALEIETKMAGPDSITAAVTMGRLATCLASQGHYREAVPLAHQALSVALGKGEPGDLRTARLRISEAIIAIPLGRERDAAAQAHQALTAFVARLGDRNPTVSLALAIEGEALGRLGRYAAAADELTRALELREQAVGPDHPDTADVVLRLASLYARQGRFTEAGPLADRAVSIYRKAFDGLHPRLAEALAEQALVLDGLGRAGEAEPLHAAALEMARATLGDRHPMVSRVLHDRARCLHAQRRDAEALPLAQQALAIREEVYGGGHVETGETLLLVATILAGTGQPAEARSEAQAALASLRGAEFAPPDLVHEATALSGSQAGGSTVTR